jgi:F0F1-type ATP synthase membrane subunit b/b'
MLSINGNVIVVFLIVWLLVFVLTRLFFNPVRRVRDERKKEIQGNREAYEEALASHRKSVQEIEQALKQAKAAAESAGETLMAEGLKEKNRMLGEISAEYKRQVEKARLDLDQTIVGLKQKLEAEASALAETIEKKFLN